VDAAAGKERSADNGRSCRWQTIPVEVPSTIVGNEGVPHIECGGIVDEGRPARAWVIEYQLNNWYVLLYCGSDEILLVDPGIVQLLIVAKDRNGPVIEAFFQLRPVTVRAEFYHPEVDAGLFEVFGDYRRRGPVVLMGNMADVKPAALPPPRLHLKSPNDRVQQLYHVRRFCLRGEKLPYIPPYVPGEFPTRLSADTHRLQSEQGFQHTSAAAGFCRSGIVRDS